MRRLFFAGALLASLLILGGCSEGYTICSAPIAENCRKFRSRAHYERWVKDESRRQLTTAQRFPDDYRDVIAATLKELLQTNQSEFPNHRRQYFLSVFGEDADAMTLTKLQQLGIEAVPGSQYVKNVTHRPQDSQGVYLDTYEVYVSQLKHLASGEYRIEFGYYCGDLCAGHFAYRLSKHDGVWVFTGQKALWAS